MSQRNQHLTHAMLRKPATTTPKQFQTTWCFGKDWQHAGGARDLQSATICPESCHSVTLAKYCFLLRLRHFSQKRSLQQSHFRGRKHIGFLDSKKWSFPVSMYILYCSGKIVALPIVVYIRQSAMDALVGSITFIVRPDGVRVAIDNGICWSALNSDGIEREKRVFTPFDALCI